MITDNNANTISMTPLSSIALAQIREDVKMITDPPHLSSIASAQDKGRRQMITDPPLIKLKNSRVQKFTKKKDNNASTISITPPLKLWAQHMP